MKRWHNDTYVTGQSPNSPERESLMMYVMTPNTGLSIPSK